MFRERFPDGRLRVNDATSVVALDLVILRHPVDRIDWPAGHAGFIELPDSGVGGFPLGGALICGLNASQG
jgi:hypothetical protein